MKWQHRLSEDGGEIEELSIEGYHLVVYHDGGEWYLAIRFPDGTSEVTTWTAEDAAKDAGIRVAVAV